MISIEKLTDMTNMMHLLSVQDELIEKIYTICNPTEEINPYEWSAELDEIKDLIQEYKGNK